MGRESVRSRWITWMVVFGCAFLLSWRISARAGERHPLTLALVLLVVSVITQGLVRLWFGRRA